MSSRIGTLRARTITLFACLAAYPAHASSSSAWEDFRRSVEAACLDAAAPQITDPRVVVDPFGSQSYGLALITGTSSEDGAPQSLICVYDKASSTVEVGGVMALERTLPALRPDLASPSEAVAPVQGPVAASERLLSPSTLASAETLDVLQPPESAGSADAFAGRCDADCAATLELLSAEDRTALVALAAQIDRTIAANAGASLSAASRAVRDGAEIAATLARGEDAALTPPGVADLGATSCTLYYFGFNNEAARTVGTHQCRIAEGDDGALVVEKTSGERLRATIQPLVPDLPAFVGRTFDAGAGVQDYDAENPVDDTSIELGNTVGFAAGTDERILLISSQLRRFDPSETFFWVLALDR